MTYNIPVDTELVETDIVDDATVYAAPSLTILAESNNIEEISSVLGLGSKYVTAVKYSDGKLYMSSTDVGNSVMAYDVSDENDPFLLGSIGGFYFQDLAVDGTSIYALDASSGDLISIDASNPGAMVVMDRINDWSGTYDSFGTIKVYKSNVLFTSNGGVANGYLTAVSIATPSSLSFVGNIATGVSYGFDTYGDYAIVAQHYSTNYNRVVSIDMADLGAMSVVGTANYASLSGPELVSVYGDKAYIGFDGSPLTLGVLDISDPASMVSLGTFADGSKPTSIVPSADMLIMMDVDGDTKVLDVSSPASISQITSYEYASSTGYHATKLVGNMFYAAGFSDAKVRVMKIPDSFAGDTVGGYNFRTTRFPTHYEVLITETAGGTEVARGELFKYSSGVVYLYFGTGCASNCGTESIIHMGDGTVHVFSGGIDDGWSYGGVLTTEIPFDDKQYTATSYDGDQSWTVKSLGAFDGISLGMLQGDTVDVVFKDSLGTVIKSITGRTIGDTIASNLPKVSATDMIYAGEVIEANGTVEIDIHGAHTEIGHIFASSSYYVGATELDFSHAVKNFDRSDVKTSGFVDYIRGNRVLDYKGSYLIQMSDYDTSVKLSKLLTSELVAVDGSDTTDNSAPDGSDRFASTKIICRVVSLDAQSTIKNGEFAGYTPVKFWFREIV